MRNYLLYIFSFLLLTYLLPDAARVQNFSPASQAVVKASCALKQKTPKAGCKKQCLHQHERSTAPGAATLPVDCQPTQYTVLASQPELLSFPSFPLVKHRLLPPIRRHLDPALEDEPKPPRYSIGFRFLSA